MQAARTVCVFLAPLPNPFHFSSWCQSHGFQAPRALNQNQIVFLTTLNPPPCWWLAKAHALALSTSISLWTQRTTYQRSDHICSFISWLQEGRCLAWPQMKGSPLLITSMFFLSLLLSRAAPSLSEISLCYSSGEMQPCQLNYITLIAKLETTIDALFPRLFHLLLPLLVAHMLMWYWKSLCASNRPSSVVREQKTCIINMHNGIMLVCEHKD